MDNDLLPQIERCMEALQVSEHRFGMLAANNGRLVERMRQGGEVLPRTERKIRDFLKAHSPDQPAPQHETTS